VIAKRCFDLSKLLRAFTVAENDNQLVLTLSRADEKTPFPAENKRSQVRHAVEKEVFPKARNFK
jgi:error-prone DNA polymerase